MENKEFEKYLNNVEFNDKPDYQHRDKLEKKLIVSLSEQSRKEKVKKVKFRRIISKLAAAAIIVVGVYIGITNFNGTNAWAQVIRAFNKVENVHVTQIATMSDGTIQQRELWFRMPKCFYEDTFLKTTIDNGTDRLVIDKQKKTAQFSDSFTPYKSIAEQSIFEQLSIFRNENQDEIKYKKLSDESTKDTIVFKVQYESPMEAFEGKAWVDARTMLPLRVEVDLRGESSAGNATKGEVICDYEQIPDSIFAMVIPDGYKELPREKTGLISGKVIDENNNVVEDAIVCIADKSLTFTAQTRTNTGGEFSFKIPPEGTGKIAVLNVMLRAFRENDPNRVAWTIITDPNKADPRSVEVPGEVGQVKIGFANILKDASGIVLKMEPAGTIFGYVTDDQNEPVRNATVTARAYPAYKMGGSDTSLFTISMAGQGERGQVQVQTDQNGRYEFHNLPRYWDKSDYILKVEADGFNNNQIQFDLDGALTILQKDIKLEKLQADNKEEVAFDDTQSIKEYLSDEDLVEYYKAHPLEEGQMDFRKGKMTGGLTIGSIQGLEGYEYWQIGTTVNYFAKYYPNVSSYGRMRFEGDFNDVFLQYDIIGRGNIPDQKYVAEVLSRVGIEIVENEDLCTVWIAEYNGQKLKPASLIKIPYPKAPAGTIPGSLSSAGMSKKIKYVLNNLAQQQDIVIEDKTGIDEETELTQQIPNFKTQVGADLAKEWFKDNFGITFKIEQRRMKVWVVRKKDK